MQNSSSPLESAINVIEKWLPQEAAKTIIIMEYKERDSKTGLYIYGKIYKYNRILDYKKMVWTPTKTNF